MNSDLSLIKPILDKYKNDSGSLISILQAAQDAYGYLPKDIIYHIAKETDCTPARVMGVVTFYAQFRQKPIGKNLIMLCKGTACHVNNADQIENAISGELSIEDGETTDDTLFTLQNVACLGCCSLAPVMTINDETYATLTNSKTVKILRDIKKQAKEKEQ